MSDITVLKEAVDDLQMRLAFQEDTLQQLDSVLIQQNDLIDRMNRRLAYLEERLKSLETREPGNTEGDDKPPPHY